MTAGDLELDGDGTVDGDPDLALYALGALDDTEARTVETRLASDADAAAAEARLRRAAAAIADAADLEVDPPIDLRDRVLDAARAARPPAADDISPTSAADLHRAEGERLVELLRSLPDDAWHAPVDPPEFAGWTVRDVVAHLATVEAYLAGRLGIDAPIGAETELMNEERTALAIGRHRGLLPEEAVAELETFLRAVDDDVDRLRGLQHRPVEWWGAVIGLAEALVIRAFELWVHAADIARAVGRPEPLPPAASLRTMSDLATSLTPTMCALAGTLPDGASRGWVRIRLTGPGGADHDVALDPERATPPPGDPLATITVDVVDFCRAVGRRLDPDLLPYRSSGDDVVAAAVVAALPALATL